MPKGSGFKGACQALPLPGHGSAVPRERWRGPGPRVRPRQALRGGPKNGFAGPVQRSPTVAVPAVVMMSEWHGGRRIRPRGTRGPDARRGLGQSDV